MKLTRAKFEQLVEDLLQKTMGPCKQALADAAVSTVEQIDEVVLVGGSTRIPRVQQIVKELFGKEPHKGVNPDEVVAVGAAIQAGVLAGDVKDLLLLDVTPLSLGHRDAGRRDDHAHPRNTTIPTQEERDLLDGGGQPDERRGPRAAGRAADGARQPDPGQVPPGRHSRRRRGACRRSRSTFDIDANGIVNVQAKDKGTGKEQKITITASSGLSKDEVDRMVSDAEAHAAEDKTAQGRGRDAQPGRPGGLRGREVPEGLGRQARRGRSAWPSNRRSTT